MSETYTEVKHTNVFSRFFSSLGGILVGVILFLASFALLFWNEGRVNLSLIAKTSENLEASQLPQNPQEWENKLVAVTGEVKTKEKLSDGLYLREGDYLQINRRVEMFAWVEKSQTRNEDQLGGGQKQTTTYSYSKEWVSNPESTANFKQPEGKSNPELPFRSQDFIVKEASVGVFSFDPNRTGAGAEAKSLTLNMENTVLNKPENGLNGKIEDNYVFLGNSIRSPEIGNVRVSYQVVLPGQKSTVFGKVSGSRLEPFLDKKTKTSLYVAGSGDREQAISTLDQEHKTMTWILRGAGMVMMWIGLNSLFGPISIILGVLPFLGSLSRNLFGAVSFFIALILTTATVLLSLFLHNIWAVVIFVSVLVIGATIYFFSQKNKPHSQNRFEGQPENTAENKQGNYSLQQPQSYQSNPDYQASAEQINGQTEEKIQPENFTESGKKVYNIR